MRSLSIVILLALGAAPAAARPISWPGGLMVMVMHDDQMTGAMALYTVDRTLAFGLTGEARRPEGRANGDWQFGGLIVNHLVQRWNMPDAQANLYLSGTFGLARGEDEEGRDLSEPGGSLGLIADIEDRRFLAAYEARYFHATGIESAFSQHLRLGVAPYIGDYGDLHTWVIVQAHHMPEEPDPLTTALILRLFKGNTLGEIGLDDEGDVIFNLTLQF